MIKVNFNFKLRDASGNVFGKHGNGPVTEMLGKDAVSTALIQYATLPFWKRLTRRWSDTKVYAFIERMRAANDFFLVTEDELRYVMTAVKRAKFDAFVRGEILTQMFILEEKKPSRRKAKK
jgi:hypothetical protein